MSERKNITAEMIEDADLYDSETGDMVMADGLGISDEAYRAAVRESMETAEAEGHIEVAGRRMYAA